MLRGRQAGTAVWRRLAWGAPPARAAPAASTMTVGRARTFATDKPTGEALPDEFKRDWAGVAPNLDLPRFPLSYMESRPEVPSTLPSKLTANVVLPYKWEVQNKQVDMVIVPASTGQLGILPGHVPIMAQLKPGLLSIHEGDSVEKYFVSSGFAFVHPNSVLDVVAIEGVPLDQLDKEEVRKSLDEYLQKVNSANTDLEKAEAQIGVEVYSSLSGALA